MVLSYSPLAAQSGTVNFIPTATYLGPGGQTLTYTNSILNLAYSSIVSTSFVAVGDYGTTISSTNSPPTTWSANINSPFATSSIIANGIVINGNTYAIILSNGVVESSTQNGLFWTISGTTNLNASTCNIVFDGTNYYTCGTSNLTAGNCVSGRGCIERNATLSGIWTTLAAPSTAIATNNFYYFTNGITKAYIAVIASTTAGGGILSSFSGGPGTFALANSAALAANSNMTSAVAWDGAVTVFSSTGTQTTSEIGYVQSNWVSSTAAPQASPIKAVIYNNGWFTISNSAGRMFSANWNGSAISNFRQVYAGTNQINSLVYINSIFLAATSSGAIEKLSVETSWTIDPTLTTGNYNAAYFESSTGFWLTGTNSILNSPTLSPAAGATWRTPALIGIAKYGNTYLAIDNSGFIYSSSNLASWTQQTNPSGKKLSAITCPTTNLCLAVGESGTIIKYNGTSWAQLSSGVTTNTYLRGITCQPYPGICLAVGGTGAASSGTVLLSNGDFTSWTIKTSNLATTNLNGAGFLNDLFIVVGDAGALFLSTNEGNNWSSKTSGAGANNLNSIACGHLGCVAVGNGGSIVYSATGNRWDLQTSGVTTNLNSIVINGLFVAVGNTSGSAGVIRQSVNGTSWNTGTFPSTSSGTTNLYSVISK
jgi:hypothetical protein